jgi:hypothetical protein
MLFASLTLILSAGFTPPVAGESILRGSPTPLDLSLPRHTRALYLDAVGRTPDEGELELATLGRPSLLLRTLCGSDEFWQQWYEEELFYFLLVDNFRPEEKVQGEGIPEQLASGELNLLNAVRAVVSSSAFNRANPGNDTFVSVVFEQLLGLTVQENPALLEAGKRMYDGERASLWGMEGRGQADVVRIACAQPEFAELIVSRQYERLVGHVPPRKQTERWSDQLREEPGCFPDLVREWLGSEAYAQRLKTLRRKSDRQFIRGLYVDLTGEPPSQDVMQRHRTALAAVADSGPLRSVIARVLLNSAGSGYGERREPVEAAPLVRNLFLRFLGREPEPVELEGFSLVYEQCDCHPEILVRAVTTHQEYQYY